MCRTLMLVAGLSLPLEALVLLTPVWVFDLDLLPFFAGIVDTTVRRVAYWMSTG